MAELKDVGLAGLTAAEARRAGREGAGGLTIDAHVTAVGPAGRLLLSWPAMVARRLRPWLECLLETGASLMSRLL